MEVHSGCGYVDFEQLNCGRLYLVVVVLEEDTQEVVETEGSTVTSTEYLSPVQAGEVSLLKGQLSLHFS